MDKNNETDLIKVQFERGTLNKLIKHKKVGTTYDDIVLMLLDYYNQKDENL